MNPKKVLELSRELRTEQAITLLLGESLKQYNLMSAALDNTIGAVKQHVNQVNNDADAMYDNSRLTGIILIVGAILIAVFLTLLLVRNTIRQLGKDPGELNGIAHRVVNGDYDIDDGSRKIGVYGAIVEMVNALKRNIDNAQHESENAKEQSRKAQEAMEQAEAASREAQSKTEAMLAAADKLEQVGSVVSSASTELSAQIEQSDRGAAESAQRLSEAATAMNEMNATVQEVAKKRRFRLQCLRRDQTKGRGQEPKWWQRPCTALSRSIRCLWRSRKIWSSLTNMPRTSPGSWASSRTLRTRPTCWP